MRLSQCLRNARELYLTDAHVLCGTTMLPDLLNDAAAGDAILAERALELLDKSVPNGVLGSFSQFLDGGEDLYDENGHPTFVYRDDRAKAEVVAVFSRACVFAVTLEEESDATQRA